MLNEKFIEVLKAEPDSAFAIVTQGETEPHVVNSWNSYVTINEEGHLLIPAGRMEETEKNIMRCNKVALTISICRCRIWSRTT